MTLFPAATFQEIWVDPWTMHTEMTIWVVAMSFLVSTACGLLGNFLLLRRMTMMGDAISHSVLPGIVVAYLVSGVRVGLAPFLGAVSAGMITVLLIDEMARRGRVRHDAAMGIVYSSLFAFGVVLISLNAGHIDLDAQCVLFGELGFIALEQGPSLGGVTVPLPILIMAGVMGTTVIAMVAFYHTLVVTSFDSALAAARGLRPTGVHRCLMCMLTVVVIAAFQAVGAILVVAMLVIPGASSAFLFTRLPARLWGTVAFSAGASLLGFHLARWAQCSTAPAVVLAAAALFCIAWAYAGALEVFRRRNPA
jgi:manganese/zinc/iron transport system permease protein